MNQSDFTYKSKRGRKKKIKQKVIEDLIEEEHTETFCDSIVKPKLEEAKEKFSVSRVSKNSHGNIQYYIKGFSKN